MPGTARPSSTARPCPRLNSVQRRGYPPATPPVTATSAAASSPATRKSLMSAPADPPRDAPPGPPGSPSAESAPGTAPPPSTSMDAPEQPAGKRRPWAWIVVCVLLVIVAGGLVVWALSLQSDLNDQKDQTAAAEQQAQDASAQVDDITQAVSDLGDQLRRPARTRRAASSRPSTRSRPSSPRSWTSSSRRTPAGTARGRAARRSPQRPTRQRRPRPPRQRRRARPDPRNAARNRGRRRQRPPVADLGGSPARPPVRRSEAMLIYSMSVSVDGLIADRGFGWTAPTQSASVAARRSCHPSPTTSPWT